MGLEQLKQGFNPKRTFACSHTKIEVDGIFVRVPDEGESDWEINQEKGTITLPIDDMLQDPAIIRSARVSTGRDTTAVNEKAQGMVTKLWAEKHVTPSEGAVHFRLKITTPIMYAQPFFRLFASHNEHSGRYSKIEGAYYTPSNLNARELEEFTNAENEAQELYRKFSSPPPVGFGIANEMARLIHLYRFYTKFYMTISLRHVKQFITWGGWHERNRYSDTEFEQIRPLFSQILETWTPWSYEALQKYPFLTDFSWAQELAERYEELVSSMPYIEKQNYLNKGQIRLLEVFGQEKLMFACLNDYPNPLKGFGHGGMTLLLTMPIHVFRQWVRHRYGTTTEQGVSFDGITDHNTFYIPEHFRKQIGKPMEYTFENCGPEENEKIKNEFISHIEKARERYKKLRASGTPQRIAAMILPYCFYVSAVITYPVEAWLNFFELRTSTHAQAEIRKPALIIWDMFKKYFPETVNQLANHLSLPKQPNP